MPGHRFLKVAGSLVLLDSEDYVRLCHIKWKIRSSPVENPTKYICCNRVVVCPDGRKRRKTIYIHRAVLCPPYGLDLPKENDVHHKNGDVLDNRKENLELLLRRDHMKVTPNLKGMNGNGI